MKKWLALMLSAAMTALMTTPVYAAGAADAADSVNTADSLEAADVTDLAGDTILEENGDSRIAFGGTADTEDAGSDRVLSIDREEAGSDCILSIDREDADSDRVLSIDANAAPSQEPELVEADGLDSGEVLLEASASVPFPCSNVAVGLIKTSYLTPVSGGLMRVFLDKDNWRVGVEYYDSSMNFKSRRYVNLSLNYWGGFYAGSDAYYLVEGSANSAENDAAEVIRVSKYDLNWNKLGTAKITSNPKLFGGEVGYPFDYGRVEMTEVDGKLYIVTGHEGYVDPYVGQGHQGFLMVRVDESTMTGSIVACDLWHSFSQYITTDGSNLYVQEQSEGSRCTVVDRFSLPDLNDKTISVLDYGGDRTSVWSIPCYASVNGIALSASNILSIGSSIDQSKYDTLEATEPHNIYLTVTPKNNFSSSATTVKWLTSHKNDSNAFSGLNMTKINDNRFLITWSEFQKTQTAAVDDPLSGGILHYAFIDGSGNRIGKEYTAAATISDCQPIVYGDKVVFYTSNEGSVDFYSIDAASGAFSKKVYRTLGGGTSWSLSGDVMTVKGTGAIRAIGDEKLPRPISSVGGYSYSVTDGMFWGEARTKVKTINIQKGVESIGAKAFKGMSSLQEVILADGVKSIGDEAFASCSNMRKITIPASVRSIGKDVFKSGWYDYEGNPIVYVMICAPAGSYAIEYAKANGIRYEEIEIQDPTKASMYRLYNPNSGEHFYTAAAGEKNMLVSVGWNYEGIGWIAPKVSGVPVYRLYNANAGDHHYTMNAGEKNMLVGVGWTYEGIGWYSDEAKGKPLYRQYNPNAKSGSHNYTTNKAENDWLVTVGWQAEGIGWYGVK